MDSKEFWRIIEFSKKESDGDNERQSGLIEKALSDYTPDQIVEFEKIFRHYVIEADDFRIMAAAKIIEGWVSDDSYLYFRCWLIGQGEKVFTEALKSPDSLAESVSKGTETSFEELMYVATNAYKQRTAKDEEDETFPRDRAIASGLDYNFDAPPTKGTDWTEDQLPKSYPKLWAKFH